jgi:hypothetical protein
MGTASARSSVTGKCKVLHFFSHRRSQVQYNYLPSEEGKGSVVQLFARRKKKVQYNHWQWQAIKNQITNALQGGESRWQYDDSTINEHQYSHTAHLYLSSFPSRSRAACTGPKGKCAVGEEELPSLLSLAPLYK